MPTPIQQGPRRTVLVLHGYQHDGPDADGTRRGAKLLSRFRLAPDRFAGPWLDGFAPDQGSARLLTT